MKVLLGEPLARHGYWRVGGPVDRLVIAESPDEIEPGALVLGAGSNLLAPDEGLRGTVVKLGAGFRGTEVVAEEGDDVHVRVGAGLPNVVLLQRLKALGLAGAGCLAGVPGTMGGAVAMNAGTALGEIADVLVSVEGVAGAIARADLPMRYREGGLPAGFVVTAATLRLSRRGVAEEQARVATHLARRRATQPLDLPSCGSVFRNPPGDYAGRLIESVGLKGFRAGDAQISEMHGNFVVNLGGASATDVMTCIRTAWENVRARAGVTLVPEVHVVGVWPRELWPLMGPSSML
ncbi:MAG: UDP-N-acetylmuramate dehydrogenase [Myxococcota bacterium]